MYSSQYRWRNCRALVRRLDTGCGEEVSELNMESGDRHQSAAGHGSSDSLEHWELWTRDTGHVTRHTTHGTRDHVGARDAARDTGGHAGRRHHRYVTVTVRAVCTCKCCDTRTFCKLHRRHTSYLPHTHLCTVTIFSIPSWPDVCPGAAAGGLLHLPQCEPVLDPAPHG